MKIALVIGHDIDNQGAYGNSGISEFRFNDLLLSDMGAAKMFPDKHEYALFYRSTNTKKYSRKMKELHKRLDAWGADISIEFHFNSFSNRDVHGHEVLYCSKQGKKIANKLNDSYDKHLPTSNRGIKKVTKKQKGGWFCCIGKSVSIIAEPFFSAHQERFVWSGDMREPLKKSLQEFFETL